jgi:hypothetical protein
MRTVILSTLFLSTVLLNFPSVTKGQGVTLEARNEAVSAPAAVAKTEPATDVSSTSHPHRISTGVTWPKLISAPDLKLSTADFPTTDLAIQHMVVSYQVKESGIPQNIHVVKSVCQTVDQRVLTAIRQYRYSPGTLDDQAVPVDVNLVVNFQER